MRHTKHKLVKYRTASLIDCTVVYISGLVFGQGEGEALLKLNENVSAVASYSLKSSQYLLDFYR